ncbi:FliA/WhiG family RNA polymerase sigma factor [Scandinavium sp. TWS1a]|uniref:FliA/WhiG family RNA polymerase sigma factor n=1 Tax=Scandinavium tedordense TaxID=2926521 RepID=UPI00135BE9B0|nr:FliA/WhiG family RNA polymerase sigma factor [Scandinavium tedordense]MCS2171903.1 FliA/WhiG family RNA polymerase sigma factor [Scandinavium tedordense]
MQQEYEGQAFQVTLQMTPQEENQHLMGWLPLVRKIVRQLSHQCSHIIDRQDMEQIALMGLLSAIRRYGVPDENFAGYASQRIRGAILDELRSLDWRPRQLRQKYHRIKDLIRTLRQQLGHEPEWSELAPHGIDANEYQEYLQLENAETMSSLDELLSTDQDEQVFHGRRLEEQFITQDLLSKALAQLTEVEGQVLAMYYQKCMNLKEIALVLGVTESRVCQMNKRIMEKIRAFFYQE